MGGAVQRCRHPASWAVEAQRDGVTARVVGHAHDPAAVTPRGGGERSASPIPISTTVMKPNQPYHRRCL